MSDPGRSIERRLATATQHVDWQQAMKPRGVVRRVADGVAVIEGLQEVRYEELLAFDSGAFGMAFDLREFEVGAVLLSGATAVSEGDCVIGMQRLPSIPTTSQILGRIVDPLGHPLDEGSQIVEKVRAPLFRPAPEIIERCSVERTLWTGVMAIDAAIPIGRGQRELIIGDRNTGKTALAIDAVASQKYGDVACVYVMIGQPMSRVQALRDVLEQAGCLHNTVIVAAYASDSPGLQYLAPMAGASLAESFRDVGGHALVVYDDLTKHADAYRELALLLDRPPGREAYPGDIFYLHAELLERAAALNGAHGGGSVTALPIVETTDGDISAYIPTNLISITDGQIYLDANRFERDQRPAIDIGRSVSRVGAIAQPEPLRKVAKNIKIQLSRFESLEKLSRVGLDIDAATQTALQRGRILRELLRQPRLATRSIAAQVIALAVARAEWLDNAEPSAIRDVLARVIDRVHRQDPQLIRLLDDGKLPGDGWEQKLKGMIEQAHESSTV